MHLTCYAVELLMAVNTEVTVFRHVKPCNPLERYTCFGRTFWPPVFTMKMSHPKLTVW
jgi:hypothetical protein